MRMLIVDHTHMMYKYENMNCWLNASYASSQSEICVVKVLTVFIKKKYDAYDAYMHISVTDKFYTKRLYALLFERIIRIITLSYACVKK
jgi:hypothetical protein